MSPDPDPLDALEPADHAGEADADGAEVDPEHTPDESYREAGQIRSGRWDAERWRLPAIGDEEE